MWLWAVRGSCLGFFLFRSRCFAHLAHAHLLFCGRSPLYTSLGVITKGTIIEVNCSDLGLVTPSGKVVWGKYAQVTNNPENDGCINAVLLV